MIAALFVARNGTYHGLPNVEPWDIRRDARRYGGPWPVVAHPPCGRWGRFWPGVPGGIRKRLGDDGGCFAAALAAVRRFGGVLEHPEASSAWDAFGLVAPARGGGWIPADWLEGFRGWTCCVEQGKYGHRVRKRTWLYVHGLEVPPSLDWGKARKPGACENLSRQQRSATPLRFRDLLISIAEQCQPERMRQ
jgi:hypothetical protein